MVTRKNKVQEFCEDSGKVYRSVGDSAIPRPCFRAYVGLGVLASVRSLE